MGECEVCGNEYDKSFEVRQAGKSHVFDSFECAIHALISCGFPTPTPTPTPTQTGKVIGGGEINVESDGKRASIKSRRSVSASPSSAVERYPCRRVPLHHNRSLLFHGGDTGSNPVRDANTSRLSGL